jgi:hypothetical protein
MIGHYNITIYKMALAFKMIKPFVNNNMPIYFVN